MNKNLKESKKISLRSIKSRKKNSLFHLATNPFYLIGHPLEISGSGWFCQLGGNCHKQNRRKRLY